MRLSLALGAASAAAQTIKLLWTTDGTCSDPELMSCGPRGPDGPWQGLQVPVGGFSLSAMLPSGHWRSEVLAKAAGGTYDPKMSKTANISHLGNNGLSNPWGSADYYSGGFGPQYLDMVGFGEARHEANMSIIALQRSEIGIAGQREYAAQFGTLGLAPARLHEDPAGVATNHDRVFPPSILEQFKSQNLIQSQSYSLHLGSVPLGQPGSLVLGGYEQNRALGDVAIFGLVGTDRGRPKAFLVDLTLGVETGASPFDKDTKLGTVWQAPETRTSGERKASQSGGAEGSALFLVNPQYSYIQLPPGNCEALAEHLPLTWRDDFEMYAWNTEDPQFERIVNSPAYLGFVVADRLAKNVTIKIPFKLLNLTLEEPIVDKPTQYFPCRSKNDTSFWTLGRAFLQGAFLGFNYEKDLMYLAQAPGPDMSQEILVAHEEEDISITTNPADEFEKSWRSTWKVIEEEKVKEDGGGAGSGSQNGEENADENSGSNDGTAPPAPAEPSEGLSGGVIAGIAVGASLGLVAFAIAAFLAWRRRRSAGASAAQVEEKEEFGYTMPEAPGGELPHELFSPQKTHEAPGAEMYHELDGMFPMNSSSRQPPTGRHGYA
ncbi:hypothetical protein HJFPF1_05989 [Paramyrothecium foliicola]|nr:hypothetical protein HJFPF1_05989 [Paramyrothecium foliicola]